MSLALCHIAKQLSKIISGHVTELHMSWIVLVSYDYTIGKGSYHSIVSSLCFLSHVFRLALADKDLRTSISKPSLLMSKQRCGRPE